MIAEPPKEEVKKLDASFNIEDTTEYESSNKQVNYELEADEENHNMKSQIIVTESRTSIIQYC